MTGLVIAHARLMTAGRPAEEPVDVYISSGRILDLDVFNAPAGVKRIEADGGTLIPGLIDAHCHAYGISLDLDEMEHWPLSYVALKASERLGRALRRGFTTVRDVAGGDPGLARAIREGVIPAPRYLWTGPALSQTGGHGDGRDPMRGGPDYCGCATNIVDSPDAMRRRVRQLLGSGAHAIKLLTSGGVVSPTDPLAAPQFSAAEIAVAAEEAGRRGTYVTAHAYSPDAIVHSIENGVRCIEHGNLLDAATAAAMAASGTALVPTLATYDAMDRRGHEVGLTAVGRAKNTEVLTAGREAIRLARAAGVLIGFGTDLMGDLEDAQLEGLRLQCDVEGIERTIAAATAGNAAILRLDRVGRIEPGYAADLVLFTGDLRREPELAWAGSRTVIQGGRVVAD
jgi:imidazolonepropionase-like amidohydrolase